MNDLIKNSLCVCILCDPICMQIHAYLKIILIYSYEKIQLYSIVSGTCLFVLNQDDQEVYPSTSRATH